MRSLRYNTNWNLLGSVIPMLVGVITIPILMNKIGIERFGILSIIWVLIGYFSIFDFGVGRALTQGVAKLRESKEGVHDLIKIGLNITLIAGILGGSLLAVFSSPLAYSWLNASAPIEDDIFNSILCTSAAIPIVTVTSGLKGILEGYERFREVNIIKIFLGVLNFLAPLISVFIFGESLLVIATCLILVRLSVFLWHLFLVNRLLGLKKIVLAKRNDNKETRKNIYQFGSWMTLSNLISPLMVNADRFLIANLLGAGVVAYYTVPFDLAIRALVIPAAYTASLFPRFSNMLSLDTEGAIQLLRHSQRKVMIGMLLISVAMGLLSHIGLSIWISKEFADESWFILVVISVGIYFNGAAQVPHSYLQASGRVKLTAIIHVLEFIFYSLVLYALLLSFGIIGAAYAFTIRVIVDFFILSFFAKSSKIRLE